MKYIFYILTIVFALAAIVVRGNNIIQPIVCVGFSIISFFISLNIEKIKDYGNN